MITGVDQGIEYTDRLYSLYFRILLLSALIAVVFICLLTVPTAVGYAVVRLLTCL